MWSDSLLPVAAKHLRVPIPHSESGAAEERPPPTPPPPSEEQPRVMKTEALAIDLTIRPRDTSSANHLLSQEPDPNLSGSASMVEVLQALDEESGSSDIDEVQYTTPDQSEEPSAVGENPTMVISVTNLAADGDPISTGDRPPIVPAADAPHPSRALSRKGKERAVDDLSPEAVDQLYGEAVEFVDRYLRLFDLNRDRVRDAYADTAVFSISAGTGSLAAFLPVDSRILSS